MFELGGFEQGAIEIGHEAKELIDGGVAVGDFARQHAKEEFIEVVEVFQLVAVEKGVLFVAFVV